MSSDSQILIAGAGPAGLACALELMRLGYSPRIVERRAEKSPPAYRRGLTLRPRTLAMLEPLDVVKDLITAGQTISTLRVEEDGRVLARFDLSALTGSYPFLLCIPEEKLISIFSEKLCSLGGHIEYGVAVTNVRMSPEGKIQVHFSDSRDEIFDQVIGADGANSAVRTALGIPFTGYDYPGGWFFADEYADTSTETHTGVLTLLPDGHMSFTLPFASNRVRRVSSASFEESLNLPVIVREADQRDRGGVMLLGSAASAHGPFGGIGMSASIEDALILTQHISSPKDTEDHDPRRARLELAETIFRATRIKGRAGRFFRAYMLFLCTKVPGFRRRVLSALTGND